MTTARSAGVPRPTVRPNTRELVPFIAVRELAPYFAQRVGPDAVWSVVRQTVDDLRGSVHAEALAEMTFRLARYRLERVLRT